MNIKVPKEKEDDYDGPIHTVITPDGKQLTLPPGSAPFIGKVKIDDGPIDEATPGKIMEKIYSGGALAAKTVVDEEGNKKWATLGDIIKEKNKESNTISDLVSIMEKNEKILTVEEKKVLVKAKATQEEERTSISKESKSPTMSELIQQREEEEAKSKAPIDPVQEGAITEDDMSPLSSSIDPMYLDSVKVTEEELKDFFTKCIMEDEAFIKTYYIKAPGDMQDIPVILRSRKASETSDIIERLSKKTDTGVSIVRSMNDFNLAASLVSIGQKKYDDVRLNLDERVHIIEEMPGPKKSILWDFMAQFDLLVEKLRRAHVNF